jgi:hypothetical protein
LEKLNQRWHGFPFPRPFLQRNSPEVFHDQPIAILVGFQAVGLNDSRKIQVFGDRVLIAKLHEFAKAGILVLQDFDDDWFFVPEANSAIN